MNSQSFYEYITTRIVITRSDGAIHHFDDSIHVWGAIHVFDISIHDLGGTIHVLVGLSIILTILSTFWAGLSTFLTILSTI